MLRLSVNLLSNALSFLKEISVTNKNVLREPTVFYHSYSVSIDSLCELADNCGWVESVDGYAHLKQRGSYILSQSGFGLTSQKLRLMLHDYVIKVHPIWANRILYGRKEAFIFMTKDEKACFLEADLMSAETSHDLVAWWDAISAELHKINDEKKNLIGRHGEELTIQYEFNRTGEKPYWASIDSNLAGYDMISYTDSSRNTKLLIEVKTSAMPLGLADFHITQNEWQVANTSSNYQFYLWNITETPQLAIIAPENLKHMMPINQQEGEWETVKIPFSVFADDFKKINP